MSQKLLDCQMNITRLLCQVEDVLEKHQTRVKASVQETYNSLVDKINPPPPLIPGCERRVTEITLEVDKDKRGLVLVPCGSPIRRCLSISNNNNRYIISPIPSSKKLKLSAGKVRVKGIAISERSTRKTADFQKPDGDFEAITDQPKKVVNSFTDPGIVHINNNSVVQTNNKNGSVKTNNNSVETNNNRLVEANTSNISLIKAHINDTPQNQQYNINGNSLVESNNNSLVEAKTNNISSIKTDVNVTPQIAQNQKYNINGNSLVEAKTNNISSIKADVNNTIRDKQNLKVGFKASPESRSANSSPCTDNMEAMYLLIGDPENMRLDCSSISKNKTMLDLDPIKCEIGSESKRRKLGDDRFSSADSGYENSDTDDLISHSPRSTDTSDTVWASDNHSISRMLSTTPEYGDEITEIDGRLTPDIDHIGSPSMSSSVERAVPDTEGHFYSTKRTREEISNWITAQSPYVGKIPLHMSAFKYPHNPSQPINEDKQIHSIDPVCRNLNVYEFENDSYSTTSSLPSNCDFNHNVMHSTSIVDELNNTDLHQELAEALVKEVEMKEESENDDDPFVGVKTSIDQETFSELATQLESCQSQLLLQVDGRREELHRMVDQWHRWIQNKIQLAYEQEQERLKRESQRIAPVPGVRSPTKTMCTFLNTKYRLNRDTFGTFTTHTAFQDRFNDSNESRIKYYMCNPRHVRTFESRDHDNTTEYMATAINIDNHHNYTVTDLGADTCRIFSPEGRLLKDLDVAPLDEPTYALTDDNQRTILACRQGLKSYSCNSLYSSKLAQNDVKCPQCIAVDSVGNYIVSDMHDCGSVIVTLEHNSLIPVRMFCGAQYDDAPQSFSSAWYIHVTKGNNNVVLSDRDDHTIKCYTAHGQYLWSAGGLGAEPGEFFTPAGITEDNVGNIIVADCNNDRVQLFSNSGEWLGVVLCKGVHDIKCPTDVTLDRNGNLIVLQANGKVSSFSYMTNSGSS